MTDPGERQKKTLRCPQCKKTTEIRNNPHKPFCSERCKMVDLGAWFTGQYSIKEKEKEDGSTEE